MKKSILITLIAILLLLSIFSYIEFNQLSYDNKFYIKEAYKEQHFMISTDTVINNEILKVYIKGSIVGTANISVLNIYRSKEGSLDSSYIINTDLNTKSNIDTTLKIPYYNGTIEDKLILSYKPKSVQQTDLTIKAGSFGLPFEKILTRLL